MSRRIPAARARFESIFARVRLRLSALDLNRRSSALSERHDLAVHSPRRKRHAEVE